MRRLAAAWTLVACTACGERSSSASDSNSSPAHFISIDSPKEGWAESIAYELGDDGSARLTLDGVELELRDPAAYRLDWGAIGMEGIQVTASVTYQSSEPVEGALLSALGREVKIVDGTLVWGDESLGPVVAGDRAIVDAAGLRLAE